MLFITTYLRSKENGSVDIDPPEVRAAKENWVGIAEDISFVGNFLFDFEITDNEDNFINSSEINECIINKNLALLFKNSRMN